MTGQLSHEDRKKVLEICCKWDTDNDGAISRAELGKALREIFHECSDRDVEDLLQTVDINDDGVIQYGEFLHWMELPAHGKLSFGDHLKSHVLTKTSTTRRRTATFVTSPAHETGRTPSASSGGGLPAEFRDLLGFFTHPLLERFKVVSAFDRGAAPQVVMVSESGDRSAASDIKLECAGNIFSITSAPSVMIERMVDPPGYDQILEELECLSEAYEEILTRFCEAMSQKEGAAITKLQMRPILCVSLSLSAAPLNADKTWAAMALAVARLPAQAQNCILSTNRNIIIEVVDDSSAATQLAATLKAKIELAAQPLLVDKAGRLPLVSQKFDWIRKDNRPVCRLHRLQTFMMTQRAISDAGYYLARSSPIVRLPFIQEMIRGTKIKTVAPGAIVPTRGRMETRVTLGTATVMEEALALEKKGRRVAAVSAASAYQRGGGASTGGRHALEEAWCTMSTLFKSLQTLESKPTWHVAACGSHSDASTTTDFMTHVPTLGCVVSPAVEVFREPTSQGYGFLQKPAMLSAVISVAMFNRNPGVSDSPLDSPDDPSTYIAETQLKFEAVVAAAIELNIQDLIIPDAGCGVFQNDPLVVGGCLGAVLHKYKGHLENVIVAANERSFFDACQRVFDGGDPRPICLEGEHCPKIADKTHFARCLHRTSRLLNPGGTSLDAALKELVQNPEVTAKPLCRYGGGCRIKDSKHLAYFSHPDICQPCEQPHLARTDSSDSARNLQKSSPQPEMHRTDSTDSRPICRFGEKCYSENPDHLAKFAHPWLCGESAEEAKARKDIQDSHALLDLAKNSEWEKVKVALQKKPDLINLRPEPRKFNLLHAATFQMHGDMMEWLIDSYHANPSVKTKDGDTIYDLYLEATKIKPPKNDVQKKKDELLLGWLKKLESERISLKDYHRRYHTAAIPQEERPGGDTLVVTSNVNPSLNGQYVELRHFNHGASVYRRKPDRSGVTYYLFHYINFKGYAWVIDTEITDGGGLAYVLTQTPIRDASLKPYGVYWQVYRKSILSNYYQDDLLMRVEKLAPVAPAAGYVHHF